MASASLRPLRHRRNDGRGVLSGHTDPDLLFRGLEDVDGDRGTCCAEELAQSGREVLESCDGVERRLRWG